MNTHLLTVLLCSFVCITACSQLTGGDSDDLYKRLTQGPDPVAAMETVLASAQEQPAAVLFTAAAIAYRENRLEDAGFLFYAAQVRSRFDAECFTAKGTGGNSPHLALRALSQEIGSAINPAIMAQPEVFAQALQRMQAWTPKVPANYDPGYEFTTRKTEQEALAATATRRAEYVATMSNLSTLLNDTEFFAAFRVVQAFNGLSTDPPPTKEAYDQAIATMMRIEKEKGIKGMFTQ